MFSTLGNFLSIHESEPVLTLLTTVKLCACMESKDSSSWDSGYTPYTNDYVPCSKASISGLRAPDAPRIPEPLVPCGLVPWDVLLWSHGGRLVTEAFLLLCLGSWRRDGRGRSRHGWMDAYLHPGLERINGPRAPPVSPIPSDFSSSMPEQSRCSQG